MGGIDMKDLSFLKSQIDPSKPGPLHHLAFRSEMSKGRKWPKEEDEDGWMYSLLEPFAVDQQKIEASKALRRLAQIKQVFCLKDNFYVRRRLTHTTEVVSPSALSAKILGLNVDLCVSIVKGHDVGHFPFGHTGERFVQTITGKNFRHSAYSTILLQEIERKGRANLSFEVLEGIIFHSAKVIPEDKPQEYKIAKLGDKIAFVLHDTNDAVRMGLLSPNHTIINVLGKNHRERTRNCMVALLTESIRRGFVSFEQSEIAKYFWFTYEWMFENVYSKINDDAELEILNNIFILLKEKSQQEDSCIYACDPIVLLGLLSDKECIDVHQKIVVRENDTPRTRFASAGFLLGSFEFKACLRW